MCRVLGGHYVTAKTDYMGSPPFLADGCAGLQAKVPRHAISAEHQITQIK